MLVGVLVAALLPAATACVPEAPPDLAIQRDSAGVRIIESFEPVWAGGLPWSIGDAPLLDLAKTGSGPAHDFHRVVGATRLSSGSVLVADQGSRELRLFSATGEFERRAGNPGEGPGEFAQLASVHELSDGSLAVFDSRLGRITRFSAELDYVDTRSLLDLDTRILRVQWDAEDSPIAAAHSAAELEGTTGFYRMTERVLALGGRDDGATEIATLEGAEGFLFEYGDVRPLFARSGHMAVHGTEVYLGEANALEVRVYSTKGVPRRVMRAAGPDLRLSASAVDAERSRLLSAEMPAPFREVIQGLPAPATRPAYGSLIVDREGFVWAPEARPPGTVGAATAQVFDPDGRWLGPILIPDGFRLLEVGADHILAVHTDDLGVERVQMLSLERQAP